MRLLSLVHFIALIFVFVPKIPAAEWQHIVIDGHLTLQVEVVTTQKEQAWGLGNRFSLPEGMGMLFRYARSGEKVFWMKRMKFPIDIIWINRGVIVHIIENVPPPRPNAADRSLPIYGRGTRADMVLEVPAGYAARSAIKLGSKVQLTSD